MGNIKVVRKHWERSNNFPYEKVLVEKEGYSTYNSLLLKGCSLLLESGEVQSVDIPEVHWKDSISLELPLIEGKAIIYSDSERTIPILDYCVFSGNKEVISWMRLTQLRN